MKRWFAKLVVFLLLGAIVNVAVAWASSVLIGFAETNSDIRAYRSSTVGAWNVETYSRISAFRVDWLRSRKSTPNHSVGPLPEDLVPIWIAYDPELNENRKVELWDAEARGWPLLALWSKPRSWYEALDGTRHHLPTEGAIELPLSPFTGGMVFYPKVLPLRPIWTGFASNTLFYAVILWMLWSSPFAATRFIRRRRGLCPKCGYDLRGTAQMICSECGHEARAEAGT